MESHRIKINVEFKLYLITEFERLKQNDSYQNKTKWSVILQLVILSNLENLNSEMISQGLEQKVRLERLNNIAKKQYNILQDSKGIRRIEMLDNNNNNNNLKRLE